MVFLFLLDVVSSAAIRITLNVGTWIVCKSMNGLYYAYKAVRPQPKIETVPVVTGAPSPPGVMIVSGPGALNSDSEYVVITREEYDSLMRLSIHHHGLCGTKLK
jgi:hypothetical protein